MPQKKTKKIKENFSGWAVYILFLMVFVTLPCIFSFAVIDYATSGFSVFESTRWIFFCGFLISSFLFPACLQHDIQNKKNNFTSIKYIKLVYYIFLITTIVCFSASLPTPLVYNIGLFSFFSGFLFFLFNFILFIMYIIYKYKLGYRFMLIKLILAIVLAVIIIPSLFILWGLFNTTLSKHYGEYYPIDHEMI